MFFFFPPEHFGSSPDGMHAAGERVFQYSGARIVAQVYPPHVERDACLHYGFEERAFWFTRTHTYIHMLAHVCFG